jgi:hypothetical protein
MYEDPVTIRSKKIGLSRIFLKSIRNVIFSVLFYKRITVQMKRTLKPRSKLNPDDYLTHDCVNLTVLPIAAQKFQSSYYILKPHTVLRKDKCF